MLNYTILYTKLQNDLANTKPVSEHKLIFTIATDIQPSLWKKLHWNLIIHKIDLYCLQNATLSALKPRTMRWANRKSLKLKMFKIMLRN